MSVLYPLVAFEKDDNSIFLIENESEILKALEGIDIENGEYVFWDSTGAGVSIAVSVGTLRSELKSVTLSPAAFPILDAFKAYASSRGLPDVTLEGASVEVWQRLRGELALPKQRPWT